jgi:hypothetical protein
MLRVREPAHMQLGGMSSLYTFETPDKVDHHRQVRPATPTGVRLSRVPQHHRQRPGRKL